eukprot:scaffold35019_cov52-Phaeocystis_antarctica.AAC.7
MAGTRGKRTRDEEPAVKAAAPAAKASKATKAPGSHHQEATLTEINLLLWFTAFSMLDSVGASYTSHLRFIPAESMKRYEHPQADAGGDDEGSAERCSAKNRRSR